LFSGAAYRSTGVINVDNNPPNAKTIVMALDHGEAIAKLQQELEELGNVQAKAQATFVKQPDLSGDADENGMAW